MTSSSSPPVPRLFPEVLARVAQFADFHDALNLACASRETYAAVGSRTLCYRRVHHGVSQNPSIKVLFEYYQSLIPAHMYLHVVSAMVLAYGEEGFLHGNLELILLRAALFKDMAIVRFVHDQRPEFLREYLRRSFDEELNYSNMQTWWLVAFAIRGFVDGVKWLVEEMGHSPCDLVYLTDVERNPFENLEAALLASEYDVFLYLQDWCYDNCPGGAACGGRPRQPFTYAATFYGPVSLCGIAQWDIDTLNIFKLLRPCVPASHPNGWMIQVMEEAGKSGSLPVIKFLIDWYGEPLDPGYLSLDTIPLGQYQRSTDAGYCGFAPHATMRDHCEDVLIHLLEIMVESPDELQKWRAAVQTYALHGQLVRVLAFLAPFVGNRLTLAALEELFNGDYPLRKPFLQYLAAVPLDLAPYAERVLVYNEDCRDSGLCEDKADLLAYLHDLAQWDLAVDDVGLRLVEMYGRDCLVEMYGRESDWKDERRACLEYLRDNGAPAPEKGWAAFIGS
ncbi:hypothetical protein HDU87_002761 [Geranomyces variabilis]|uniref:Uncharacterized protein n=1 Tax=Geranomyces variabilis TaxID=109894 RepID=A0AAD5XR05_9FUNG|nr:hypothetical protein HDU87_002761 [Geranomyces variabilis]